MKSDLNYNIGFFQLFCNKKSLQHQNFLPTPAGSHFLIHLYSLAKIQRNPSSSRLQFSPSCISTFTVLNLQDSKHPNTCICTSLSCIRSCTLSDIQIRNTYLHQKRRGLIETLYRFLYPYLMLPSATPAASTSVSSSFHAQSYMLPAASDLSLIHI